MDNIIFLNSLHLYIFSLLNKNDARSSIRFFTLQKNKGRFTKCTFTTFFASGRKYEFEFKYTLPNGEIIGKYFKFTFKDIYQDNCYFLEVSSRHYVDDYKDGISEKYTANAINAMPSSIMERIKKRPTMFFTDKKFTYGRLTYTKDYSNFGKNYVCTLFNRDGRKIKSAEYKDKIQDGIITYYTNLIKGDVVKKEVECYKDKIIGKTRSYDHILDKNGMLKQYLIYEGDLTEVDKEKRLDGQETVWSLKRKKGKIKYHIKFHHTYDIKTQIGHIKEYRNGNLIKDFRYDGYCRGVISYNF